MYDEVYNVQFKYDSPHPSPPDTQLVPYGVIYRFFRRPFRPDK